MIKRGLRGAFARGYVPMVGLLGVVTARYNPSGEQGKVMIDWHQFLARDPQVCHDQLCARGTRVLVTTILDSLAEGSSRDEILKSYPALRPEHIDAALAYAAELAREESLLPIAGS